MPTNAAQVDQLRWTKFPVLDDGFVCLVDVMGDDQSVVQAARVSYGEGTRKTSDDRGLIRYLMRHRHTTPFEMAEIKFLVRSPMDCWRQWIRHRTACLAGNARLSFDLPSAKQRGRRQHHAVTIEQFHRMWHHGTQSTFCARKKPAFTERVNADYRYTIPELSALVERREEDLRNMIRAGRLHGERINRRIYVLGSAWQRWATRIETRQVTIQSRLRKMHLRMCNERTGEILYTQVSDIWSTGCRPVFRVTLENGYTLKMTRDHRCLTEQGWMTLAESTSLRLRDNGDCTWNGEAPAFAVNGIPVYQDRDWLSDKRDAGLSVTQIAEQAGVSYYTIRKYLAKHRLQYSHIEKARLSGAKQRGQRRRITIRRPLSAEGLANVRRARSGVNGNFWKGGVSSERERIGRWTTDHAQSVHRRYSFCCIICGSKKDLAAHHLDPVWNNPARAYDLENLTTLCCECHTKVHVANLELSLLSAHTHGNVKEFWKSHPRIETRPTKKRKPPVRRLTRTWSKVARIEYVGEEETYDLAVVGPFHNFVANGFIVHNSVNEYSTRYSLAIDATQTTEPNEWRTQAATNRQGSGAALDASVGEKLTAGEAEFQAAARKLYEERIAIGVAREQARKDLPLSTYTEAYWKIDLHNLLHFLALRMDAHAQHEIRSYARTIGEEILRPLFPLVWEAFVDFRLEATYLTRLDRGVIQRLTARLAAQNRSVAAEEDFLVVQDPSWQELGRSRERDECRQKLIELGLLTPGPNPS